MAAASNNWRHDWGLDSPALDVPPMFSNVGDYRSNQNATTKLLGLLGWWCSVAGRPGTWVADYGSGAALGVGIPRVATIALLAAIDTSAYSATQAHLAEVLSVGDFFAHHPTGGLGTYNNGTAYVIGNFVFYATTGKSYRAIAAGTGNLPTNTAFWIIDMENIAAADVGAVVGTSLWTRMFIQNTINAAGAFWAVDPANSTGVADDENAGRGTTQAAADAIPLRTIAELSRRLGTVIYNKGTAIAVTTYIHQLSSQTTHEMVERAAVENLGFVVWKGKLTSLLGASTISGYATKTTAAGGTPYQMNLTGAAAYVGKLVYTTNAKYAWVEKALSANVAQLSTPMFGTVGGTGDPENGRPGEAGNFVNGETFDVYDMPDIPVFPFRNPGLGFALVFMRLNLSAAFDDIVTNLSAARVMACQIKGKSLSANFSSQNWTGTIGISGCQVVTNGTSGQGIATDNCMMRLHCCSLLDAAIFVGGGSQLVLQEGLTMVGAGAQIATHADSEVVDIPESTPTLQLGAFGTANDVFRSRRPTGGGGGGGGSVRLASTAVIYGTGNTGHLIDAAKGVQWSLASIANMTWVTSAAKPLLIAGVEQDYADLDFHDLSTGTVVTQGGG